MAFLLELGVFFLQLAGVQQHDLGDLGGGLRRVNRPLEAFFDKFGDQAAVVQMGVRQENRIHFVRFDTEILPVAILQVAFLIQAAVDHDLGMVKLQQVPRASDIFGRSEKT